LKARINTLEGALRLVKSATLGIVP
jgi:hypothetical protein